MITRQGFLNMPSRLSSKLEGLSRMEAKALMDAAVKEILKSLAKGAEDSAPKRSAGSEIVAEVRKAVRKRRSPRLQPKG